MIRLSGLSRPKIKTESQPWQPCKSDKADKADKADKTVDQGRFSVLMVFEVQRVLEVQHA